MINKYVFKVLENQTKEGAKSLPIYWLDRLTAIFRYIFEINNVLLFFFSFFLSFRTIKISNVNEIKVNPCQPVIEKVKIHEVFNGNVLFIEIIILKDVAIIVFMFYKISKRL